MLRFDDDKTRHRDMNCAVYAITDTCGSAVAIAANDPMTYPQNGAGVTLAVKYSRTETIESLMDEALDEIEASVPDGCRAKGIASLNKDLPMDCFEPRPSLELKAHVDDDWESRYEKESPYYIRMDMARKTAENAVDLLRHGCEGNSCADPGAGRGENSPVMQGDPSKLQHLPAKYDLTEFVVPVTITGVLTERVMAETFVQAQEKIRKKLHDANDLSSSRQLHDMRVYCDSPNMSLSPEQRATWPYWAYGWYGTDGVDWRQYETDKGPGSIPDIAEESWAIPAYVTEHDTDNDDKTKKGDDDMGLNLDKNPTRRNMDAVNRNNDNYDGNADHNTGKVVIITAGPTNERIDAVMQITNMSTGSLGARIAETMLNADGQHDYVSSQIRKIYYLSPKLARKPHVPDGQAYKLELVPITTADSLLRKMTEILTHEHVDLVVHSCAVGDYTARYSARAEDLSAEIAKRILNTMFGENAGKPMDREAITKAAFEVLKDPACKADDETKMSSYEPNLMTMMGLTPKVISHIKTLSPDTMLIGFKLLENVDKQTLFDIASKLRQKNNADYIIANDLAEIGNGKHPAMIVGHDHIMERDAIFGYCEDKDDIADRICQLAFTSKTFLPSPAPNDVLYQVVLTNSQNTDIQVAGFSSDKMQAWRIMFKSFTNTLAEMGILDETGLPYNPDDAGTDWSWSSKDGRCGASLGCSEAMASDADGVCWSHKIITVDRATVLGALEPDNNEKEG